MYTVLLSQSMAYLHWVFMEEHRLVVTTKKYLKTKSENLKGRIWADGGINTF